MEDGHELTPEEVAGLFFSAANQANKASDETLRAYAEGGLDPLTRDLLAMRLAEDDGLLERYLEIVDLDQPVAGEERSFELFQVVSGDRAAFDAYRRDLPDDAARERAERLYTEYHATQAVAADVHDESRKAKEPWWRAWFQRGKPQKRLGFALAVGLALVAVAFFQFRRTDESGLVAVRSGDERLQKETFDRILRDRTELGPNDRTELNKAPRLAFPPPENPGVLAWPESFDFVLPDRERDGGYEAGIWETQNGKPRRRLRADVRTEGGRLRLIPLERLNPGARYLVGARPKAAEMATADADRPWRVFRQWLLTDVQIAERKRAQGLAEREPGIATAILIDLGRLAEAAETLRAALAAVAQGDQVLAKLEPWIEVQRQGSLLKIDSNLPTAMSGAEERGAEEHGADPQAGHLGFQEGKRRPDSVAELERVFNEGWAAEGRGDLPLAVENLRPAYEMAKRLKHDWGIVKSGYMLIDVLKRQGQVASSGPYVEPVLMRLRRLYPSRRTMGPERRTDMQTMYAGTCYWGGMVAHQGGRYPEAFELETEGERVARECGMNNLLSRILYEKGLVQQEAGDLKGAVSTYEENLAVLAKVPESDPGTGQSWIDQYANVASNLAACYATLGESLRARRLCDRALGRKDDFAPRLRADLLSVRALAMAQMGEDRAVVKEIMAAIEIYRTLPEPSASKGESVVQTTLGIYYLKKGIPAEAENRFRLARDLAEDAGASQLVRNANINLQVVGTIRDTQTTKVSLPDRRTTEGAGAVGYHTAAAFEILQGKFKVAEKHAQCAVGIARRAGLKADLASMLNTLAWAMSQNGKRRESCEVFAEAIRLLDETVRQATPEMAGIIQQRSLGNVYSRYAHTLWRLGRVEEAAAVLDAQRGLGMRALQSGESIGRFAERGMNARVKALRRSVDAQPRTLLLQYAMLDAHRTLLLVSSARQSTRGYELRFGAVDLARGMDEWSPASDPDALGSETTELGERAAARKMALGLVGPVENTGLLNPRRFHRLVVTGDAAIHEVPFAALVDGDGKRLVERFAVSYATSITAHAPVHRAGTTDALYCMSYIGSDEDNQALAVRDAAREVARSVRGAAVPSGRGTRASDALDKLTSSRVVLFAGHAEEGVSDPLDASLQVGPGEAGRLRAREVIQRKLHCDVVVLAGCGTATGLLAGGDGLLGMAWAFRAAGSKSVVASAWRVNDQATKPLVTEFFRHFSNGAPNDEALRRAEIKVMRSPGRWHPYYWAGFKMIGDRLKVRL